MEFEIGLHAIMMMAERYCDVTLRFKVKSAM